MHSYFWWPSSLKATAWLVVINKLHKATTIWRNQNVAGYKRSLRARYCDETRVNLTFAALMSSSAKHSAIVFIFLKEASRAPVHSSHIACNTRMRTRSTSTYEYRINKQITNLVVPRTRNIVTAPEHCNTNIKYIAIRHKTNVSYTRDNHDVRCVD